MFKSDKPIKAAMQYIVEPLIENPLAASVDFLACKSCQVSTDIFHRYVSTWLFKAEGKLVGYIGCGIMMVITEKSPHLSASGLWMSNLERPYYQS